MPSITGASGYWLGGMVLRKIVLYIGPGSTSLSLFM
ncbi:hypothetical protein EYZ11_007511 [Aspergillus tanneri]|uniref:Uncharacterized protein n=1 Tax=Aspergillus tanneri TaxID=1220188 RepID=A0A4S3JD61_9EURO|nr:hypothetical protein EYZ11_007511 [Aspergillus tanneri]